MLKLKIGNNYFITEFDKVPDVDRNNNKIIYKYIAYMVGCFKGNHDIAIGYYNSYGDGEDNYILSLSKELKDIPNKDIYILRNLNYIHYKHSCSKLELLDYQHSIQYHFKVFITKLKAQFPNKNFKIVLINKYDNDPRFRVATNLVNALKTNPSSILYDLRTLEIYKMASNRAKNIPEEIKILNNDIEKLKKTTNVCPYKTTLKSLDYLNLINKATINGEDLVLELKSLPIYPSEPLGKVFNKTDFLNNKYLYRAASYIYLGNHFQMVPTKIYISKDFKLHWLETLDHTFDRLFSNNNWSGVGYPHFGSNGFCPGEFNDAMAHGREYGLTYYFIALKQYLTTANMRDLAGYKVWWYPIYNDNNELVYCAGLDAYLNEYLQKYDLTTYNNLKDKTWEEIADALSASANYGASVLNYVRPNSLNYYNRENTDGFLAATKEQDIDLYNKIMERMDK